MDGDDDATLRLGTLRASWLGHSAVLLELDGVRLLTDPVLRRRVAHLRRVAPEADAAALRDLDAVLVSHLHYDHLDLPSLERLGRSLRVIVPRGAARLLRRRGLSTVTEVEIGDEVRIGPVVVRATHAEHDGRRRPFGASAAAVGYLVTGSFTAYFAGDTDEFAAMSDLAPGLDVALLPVAGWGPRVPAGHLDPLRAAQALVRLQPRAAVPIHWGTYRRVGLDRDAALLRTPAESFAAFARDLAPEVDVRILDVGGTLVFPVACDGEVAARAGAGS